MSEHNVLLKLRRAYSKDETVAFLSKQLTEAEIEIGKLKSDLAEMEYKYKRELRLGLAVKKAKTQIQDLNIKLGHYAIETKERKDLRKQNDAIIRELNQAYEQRRSLEIQQGENNALVS